MKLSEDVFNANIKTAATRQAVGDALVELGKSNENVIVLTADLKDSMRLTQFAEKYPKRFIDVGVAEQNMAGVAAGLSLSGKIPFIASYAVFSPQRNWDQIRHQISYSNTNVKIVGGHAGLSPAGYGMSHQSLEDIALMRVLPNMTVLAPADYTQTKDAVKLASKVEGPVYIRVMRNDSPKFTTRNTPFELGAAQVLKEGSDITLAVTGTASYEVLLAARELELKHRVNCEVILFHTIKPLDVNTLLQSVEKTKKVVTVEEHQIAGGFGSAVSEILSEKLPTEVHRLGVKDAIGESGAYKDLLKMYGLDQEFIVDRVLSLTK